MELKDKLMSSYLAFEEQVDLENDIHQVRNKAIKFFEQTGFPTKRLEAWKYTSLNSILKEDYSIFPKKEDAIDYKDIKKYLIHDIDTYTIVFVDGIYSSHLSRTTHDKLDACLMSSALDKEKNKPIIENFAIRSIIECELSL